MSRSETIVLSIDCPHARLYEFLADPLNLPTWVADVGPSIRHVGGTDWVTDTTGGRYTFRYSPRNSLGVLDFSLLRDGEPPVLVPARVIPDGDGSILVLTYPARPGTSPAVFASELEWIRSDLAALKSLMESDRHD